ncbi:MAG: VOC family protein [Alphaproteobacteria bacterium]|nr:VOC family protein [Alphaproteobacteria bacterium]
MQALATNLDHVGVAVRDLDAGERAFARLGFNLTARSFHRGSRVPGAPIEEWGSGNHCAMLARGYLEIIGLTDPAKFSSVKSMLDMYQGAHIVAFEPRSNEEVHQALSARHLPIDDLRALERMAAYGPGGRERRRVAFRNMFWTRAHFTEARLQYTEHLTREVMWQPHLLKHANGAVGLFGVLLCAPDAEAVARKLAPMLGIDPYPARDGEYDLRLAASWVKILTPAAWSEWAPGTTLPPLPAPVGLAIEVKSLAETRTYLSQRGIGLHDGRERGVWVEPKDAGNTVIYFFGQ